jgi:hypothetical protein
MLHGAYGLLRHAILPTGPSGLAVLFYLTAMTGLGIAFASRAVRVRQKFDGEALFDSFRVAAIGTLAITACVGALAGGVVAVPFVFGIPAIAGLGASATVIHRRANARALPGTRGSVAPGNERHEIVVAAAAFVAGATALAILPFLLMGIALA